MQYTIQPSESEKEQGELHPSKLAMAKHFFKTHGFLKIEDLFTKELIENIRTSYEKKLDFNAEEGELDNGVRVSHRRHIVPIPFTPPFNDPALYANPILLSVLKELLGPNMILNSLGAISALPGSMDQHLHADYFPLFEEDINASNNIPTFAITMGVPLVDIDMLNGPTHIHPGSHLVYPIEQNMVTYDKQYLHGNVGSCYFWDYRTFHAGGSNHSEDIRSLLYMAYTRRWFKDSSNPDYLQIDSAEYDAIPKEHLSLFSHLQKEKTKEQTYSPVLGS